MEVVASGEASTAVAAVPSSQQDENNENEEISTHLLEMHGAVRRRIHKYIMEQIGTVGYLAEDEIYEIYDLEFPGLMEESKKFLFREVVQAANQCHMIKLTWKGTSIWRYYADDFYVANCIKFNPTDYFGDVLRLQGTVHSAIKKDLMSRALLREITDCDGEKHWEISSHIFDEKSYNMKRLAYETRVLLWLNVGKIWGVSDNTK